MYSTIRLSLWFLELKLSFRFHLFCTQDQEGTYLSIFESVSQSWLKFLGFLIILIEQGSIVKRMRRRKNFSGWVRSDPTTEIFTRVKTYRALLMYNLLASFSPVLFWDAAESKTVDIKIHHFTRISQKWKQIKQTSIHSSLWLLWNENPPCLQYSF